MFGTECSQTLFLMQKGFWVTDSWVPTLKIQWKWSTVWASWPRNSLAWYFQYTMVCGVLITSHVLSRIDIMQIACSAASCCCSSFVIVTFGLERFHTSNRKLRCCIFFNILGSICASSLDFFQHVFDASYASMCVTSCFPLRKRINDAAFPFLVKGDECITDRWALAKQMDLHISIVEHTHTHTYTHTHTHTSLDQACKSRAAVASRISAARSETTV